MRNISKGMLAMLLILTSVTAFAQSTAKKRMFDAIPSAVSLDRNTLTQSFNYSKGSDVAIAFSPELSFSGTVISNQQKYDNLKTVMIRSANNMILQITEITNTDKSISYVGRIFGSEAADGFEIKNNNGRYSMQKFEVSKIFEPCGQ